jgi:hypothetical protein
MKPGGLVRELARQYDPSKVEAKWTNRWAREPFTADASSSKPSFNQAPITQGYRRRSRSKNRCESRGGARVISAGKLFSRRCGPGKRNMATSS